jgi:hypothetical protein
MRLSRQAIDDLFKFMRQRSPGSLKLVVRIIDDIERNDLSDSDLMIAICALLLLCTAGNYDKATAHTKLASLTTQLQRTLGSMYEDTDR